MQEEGTSFQQAASPVPYDQVPDLTTAVHVTSCVVCHVTSLLSAACITLQAQVSVWLCEQAQRAVGCC